MENRKCGIVYLIGAGPGDPELISVKGKRILESCNAVVYDKLVSDELVIGLVPSVERYYVGKQSGEHTLPQNEINELLAKLAKEGKNVARLKGGDPFIFGRGGEEASFLQEQGIECHVIPGITSGLAGTLEAGIPSTDRRASSFVLLVTGHKAKEKSKTVDWNWIANARDGTVILYMGVQEIGNIVKKLLDSGMPGETPSAVIERATFSTQRIFVSTLKDLPTIVQKENIEAPALFVLGNVVNLRITPQWKNKLPLLGKKILVTRPIDQGRDLYQTLRDLGAEVIPYPTIATKEVEDREGWKKIKALSCSEAWLVFTSENGVRNFFRQFFFHIGDLRSLARFKIASMGFGTARALKTLSLVPDFVPSISTVEELARQMKEKFLLKDACIVRVKGNLSDNTIEESLTKTGAKVISIPVYHTYHPQWTPEMKEKLLEFPPDMVIFTSASSVQGLFFNLSQEQMQRLSQMKIASLGPSTSKEIRAKGLSVTIEAKIHSLPSLVEEIVNYWKKV